MIGLSKRTLRGLREAVLVPVTLGGILALLLLFGSWAGSAA